MRSSYRPGPQQLRVLRAVAAGFVTRGDLEAARRGMWESYLLNGDEDVSLTVRSLARAGLLDTPLIGPPRVNADGWVVLKDAST